MKGQVFKVIAGFYDVVSDEKKYRVRGSGKLRNSGVSPVVGDYVEFTPEAFIDHVYDRQNFLIRPKVANIDQAIIVTSLKDPNYSSILLNKFLAIIESANIHPIILFTKIDLTKTSPLEEYKRQGYEAYEISNMSIDRSLLKKIKSIFKNKLSVFTGQTGAGKSTTINNIANTDLATQEISKSLGRGKHTTRVVEIISWMDGFLIDTPGFSSLEFNLTKLELARSYHDFRDISRNCKYSRTCLHDKENDCAIKESVAKNKISKSRYEDYIKLLRSIE